MVPVVVMSDGYIATGAEPWKVPKVAELPDIQPEFRTDPEGYEPYVRNPDTLARDWAIPGTPGLEHRIGGLEKDAVSGDVSYDPRNHEAMTHVRADKVARVAHDIPPMEVHGDPEGGDLLVLGWGSTAGAIHGAVDRARKKGLSVSRAHLRHLNPFPSDLGDVLDRFDTVLVPEMNMGQLAMLLKAKYLKPIVSLNKIQGLPMGKQDVLAKIEELLGGEHVH